MKRSQTKKTFYSLILFCFLTGAGAVPVSQAQSPEISMLEQLAVYPTLIVYNGKIATMDANMTFHQAMAIRANRIWKLGDDQEIRQLAGPQTELIDLKGRTVVPGLIDAHNHPHLWALPHLGPKYDVQLAPVFLDEKNLEDVKLKMGPAIEARIQKEGSDKWVIVSIPWQLADSAIARQGITRAELDRIAPETPVFLTAGYFAGVSNTKAKELMEESFGKELLGLRVWYMVPYDIILRDKIGTIADMLVEEMEENVSFGITTFASHIEPLNVFRALNLLHREGRLPGRWAWVHRSGFSLAKDPAEFYRLLGDFTGQGDNWIWNFGVGAESWGPSGCTSAIPQSEEMRQQLRRRSIEGCAYVPGVWGYDAHLAAVKAGLRLAIVHAIWDGELDGAIRLADQVIREGALTMEQIQEPGWSFDHGHLVRPDQIPLAGKYRFWMSFQASQFAGALSTISPNFGEDYVPWIMPLNSWKKAGGRFIISSDAHVGSLDPMAAKMIDQSLIKDWPYHDSIWPWVGFWVTRELHGKVWTPEERIDRITALRGWTNWAADNLLRGKELGSLEPGKLADLAVIDKDYFTIPDRELVTINNLMTVVDGKVAFRAPNF
jgi:predicted amidohydrolase YtcJ